MDFSARLLSLHSFLCTYENIFNNEVIIDYPDHLARYDATMIEDLKRLDEIDRYRFDSNKIAPVHSKTLTELFKKSYELTRIPPMRWQRSDLPQTHFSHIKGKKQHEILSILPFIAELKKSTPDLSMIDIGGGVGNLASILSTQLGIKVISIDSDPYLHQIGAQKFKNNKQIEFLTAKFGSESKEIKKNFESTPLSLGLHTCGGLAISHLKEAILSQNRFIINFGCCYLKCSREDQTLSKLGKSLNLVLSNYALTLASRSHAPISYEDYLHKKRVKFYRYGLHMYLRERLKIDHFVSVGDSRPRIYQECFSTFVKHKLNELDLLVNDSDASIDSFYFEESRQNLLLEMFCANLIRWSLGRTLEVYLLTDRALFLSESGYKVELLECFDEMTSPRNIAIIGHRLNI